jgi:hypothetical protein
MLTPENPSDDTCAGSSPPPDRSTAGAERPLARALTPVGWPEGKSFAFSIVDDTDGSTMENVPPVYALLADLGIFTTKSVWPLAGDLRDGLACDDPRYRAWVQGLQEQGFEIALHNVSSRTSPAPGSSRVSSASARSSARTPPCTSTITSVARTSIGGPTACRESIGRSTAP